MDEMSEQARSWTTIVASVAGIVVLLLGAWFAVRLSYPEIIRNDPAIIEGEYYWGAWSSCVILANIQRVPPQVAGDACGQHVAEMHNQETHDYPKPEWWTWPPPTTIAP